MDTPLLIIILSCFTCCLFFHVIGEVDDVGGDKLIHALQPHPCLDEERSALWKFKQGLTIGRYDYSPTYHKMDSWKAGGDCCTCWDGVECDQVTGHVIGLDLSKNDASMSYINGSMSGNSTLFQLFHLQKLNLSDNYLEGQIPSSIFHMSNLSSLDLSRNSGLRLQKPSLKDLVHNLTKLEHLHLHGVDMVGSTLPDSWPNYSCLKSLILSRCRLSGELPSGIFHLPKLRILDLSSNPSLSEHLPEFDGSNSLEELRIAYCNFSGRLASIGRLSNLTYLDFSGNAVVGLKSSTFSWLSNLTKLTHLDLGEMKINGEIPSQISHLTALTYLDLSYNDLSGQMTQAWLSNLTQLVTLRLSHNQLTGQIPSSLSTLTKLVTLSLANNQLTGSILSLTNLIRLERFDLSFNRLEGAIPWVANMTHLQDIDFSVNQLEGAIPNSFFNLSNLQSLAMHSNNLSGTMELDMFHKLGDLSILKLSRNNLTLLVNEGPNSVVLDKYYYLGLGSCNLRKFPTFLLNQSKLYRLDLSQNNIHGMIPAWIWNLSSTTKISLNISHNFLTTIEDHPIMPPWSSLLMLDISFNMLQGSLPVPSMLINIYLASNNNWSGHLSPVFCNFNRLYVLDVSNCNISGTIPQCLGTSSTYLWILDLRNNNLHGTIPQSWVQGNSLMMIALSQNQLQGKIPTSLGNCTELEFIDFGNNQIVDTFPSWLGALPKLKVLMLQSNRFYGEVQNLEGNSQFAQLRIVDLSFNGFSGKIPSMYFQSWKYMESLDADKAMEYMEVQLLHGIVFGSTEYGYYEYSMKITNKGMERLYYKIPNIFRAIDFSHNQFEGEIPTSIAKLKGLQLLNFGHNNLIGTIPSWLGNLDQLESMDLSHNKLSGKIPQELRQLSFLAFFNVSDNNLSGIIPHGGQFDTFDNTSYEGNPGLLAYYHPTQPPTLTPKAGEEEEDDEPVFDKIEWMVILMGCGSGLIVGVVLGNELVVRKPLWFVKLLGRWL